VRAATTLFHASSISRAFRFDSAANVDAANFSTLGGTACSRVRRPRARGVASPSAPPLVVARGIASPRGIARAPLCRAAGASPAFVDAFESAQTRSRTHRAPNERDDSASLGRARRRTSRRARRPRRSRARVRTMFRLTTTSPALATRCALGRRIAGAHRARMTTCNARRHDVVGTRVVGARRDARTRWTGAGASAAASDKANATASDAEPVKLLTSDESEDLLKIRHTVRWKCEAWGDLRRWWIGRRRARGERRGFVRDLNHAGTKGD
jgi:hypothetical protein